MVTKRLARLNEQLKREISELIRRKVRDPRVGPVTITSVETARDLGSARVYVSAQNPNDELTAVSYTHLTLPTICSV